MKRIFRYVVPIDDRVHLIPLWSNPLAVGCRQLDVVEFWAFAHDEEPVLTVPRAFLVVGTGHPLPADMRRHWGTAAAPGGYLVWHLLEVDPALASSPDG